MEDTPCIKIFTTMLFIIKNWSDSPGGLVIKTALSMQGATHSIPGPGTKILHAACHDLKPEQQQQQKLERLDKLWYSAVIKKRIIL